MEKEFIIKNGDIYEGDFINADRQGDGIYYYNNGDCEIGKYFNDKKIGRHTIIYADGSINYINY